MKIMLYCSSEYFSPWDCALVYVFIWIMFKLKKNYANYALINGVIFMDSQVSIYLSIYCFLGPCPWHMEISRLGVHLELTSTPQPQWHRNQAVSSTYTTAHSNTRSLTHRARPGIEPISSWILVVFVNHGATTGTLWYQYFKFPLQGDWKHPLRTKLSHYLNGYVETLRKWVGGWAG